MPSIIPQGLLDSRLLSDDDRHTLIRPAGVSTQRTTLLFLEGLLAERGGSRLSGAKKDAIIDIGVAAGRTLMSELLANNTQSTAHPERLLTFGEWEIFNAKISPWRDMQYADPRPNLTCQRLLDYLGRIRAELQRRREANQLSSSNQPK